MDAFYNKQLCENSFKYKRSLDRIIDKYSRLQYQDGAIEIDLNNTDTETIEYYMKLSKKKMNKLESKLDFTYQDGGADETCVSSVSSALSAVEDDGIFQSDTTQLTASSLDESQRTLTETEILPEDQDEELEMSLRSHGTSLGDLYPGMISRIEKAWHRQHVSEVADSVLRRYRRWRQQPSRSNVNNTLNITLKHSNPKKMTSKMLLNESSNSPVKIQFMGTDATPRSPLHIVINAQEQSPGRVKGLLRREQHKPVLVMDFSGCSETSKTKEISLNETFNVSQLGEQPPTYAMSPSRPSYPSARASLDLSLRSKRLSLAAHSQQTDVCSMYASQATVAKERPDSYGSPVRQSPLKARMMTGLSRSPHAFSRSPRGHGAESFNRESMRPRSMSSSLSSPPQKPYMPMRMLNPQDSHHSLQPQLPSSQSATAAGGRHRLRRHLSFDSSLPSRRVSFSPKKLDEDFIKLYHKFVCQNKSSFFNGPPCRFCARTSEASRGHSSSSLAALALSPHRSLLRKRHRELSWDSHPQSKRSRDEYGASSPGSNRQMLRRRLCAPEYEQSHDSFSCSPSKQIMFQRFSSQQRSADAHQDTWMSTGRNVSGADFSGLGGSLQSTMVNGYSPRKW